VSSTPSKNEISTLSSVKVGGTMSYKIEISGITHREKTKDDVIAKLLALLHDATYESMTVTWPDGAEIEYEGED
jgi:hypothetical protein